MTSDILAYYDEVRKKNEMLRRQRKQALYEKIPELGRIDTQLKELSANMAINAFNHSIDSEEMFRIAEEKIKILQAKRASILTDNDYAPDYLDYIYTCKECKDRGYVKNKACKCFKQKVFERGARVSNLHTLMQFENFENFDFSLYSDRELEDGHILKTENTPSLRDYMHSVVHFLKLFVKDENLGVYIYGDTGVGKTFLCSSVCKYAVEAGKFVEYYSMKSLVEVLDNYRFNNVSKFSKPEDDEFKKAYQDIYSCDILIIDDLGSELRSRNVVSELFFIINERLNFQKKTIISSNISLEGIATVYEERTASRILGNYIHFPIEGKDLRQV